MHYSLFVGNDKTYNKRAKTSFKFWKKKVFSINMKPHLSTAMMKDKPLSWKMSKFMFKNIIARNTKENIMSIYHEYMLN